MKTISLPTHINDNFGDSMGKLFELQVQIDKTEKDIEILLDYSKASFTKPFFTLGLLLLIKQYEGKRAPISLQSEIENQSVAAYMNNIFFPHIIHCDKTNSDSVQLLLEKYQNKTYIPLLSFPIGSDEETSRIRDIFIGHLNSLLRGFVNVAQIIIFFQLCYTLLMKPLKILFITHIMIMDIYLLSFTLH